MDTVLSILTLLAITNAQNGCTDSHQCINTEIIETEIACSGYYACAESTINPDQLTTEFIDCTGTYSCHSAHDLTANKNIHCAGYKSCYSTNDISSNTIQCSGMSSCDHQSNTNALISSTSSIYCGGNKACAHSKLSSDINTYCEGLNSCSAATINAKDTVFCDANAACEDAIIHTKTATLCSGKGSCASSYISALHTQFYGEDSGSKAIIKSALIEAYGFRSLVDAIIDSEGQSSITIKMFAEMAGDGTTIICRSGSQCSLFCKNTGCQGLKFQCLTGSTCSISPNGCENDDFVGSFKGIYCPYYYHTNKDIPYVQPKTMSDSVSDTDDVIVENTDAITCNLEKECEGNTIQDIAIVECLGLNSCNAATITTTDVSQSESVNCYGDNACNAATITTTGNTGSVLCLGSEACMSGNINAKNVKCNGYRSCYDISDMFIANGAMECGATESCSISEIENYATSVSTDCTGNRACYKSNIMSKGSVLCSGHYSCVYGEIMAGKHAVCSGKGSCYGSVIDASKRVYAIGYYSAAMTQISSEWVRGYGYHSLLFAIIDSKDYEEVLIHSFGHGAGYGATVICRENSKCTLICKSSACKNMDYMCANGAICILNPIKCRDEDTDVFVGVDCPNMIVNVSPDDIEQFKKRKQYDLMNDQVYKKYSKDVVLDNEQFEALKRDVDVSVVYEENEFQLFDGKQFVGSSLTIKISAGVVIGMFVILLGICLCYNRMKHGHYVYEAIP